MFLFLTDIFYLVKFFIVLNFFYFYYHKELFIPLTCYFELKFYNKIKQIGRFIIFNEYTRREIQIEKKELRLSQQTLAEGICEQSQISKIERGHFIPSADLLFKLSQRLEVPLDYFFNEQIEIKSNLSNFKQLSARLLD